MTDNPTNDELLGEMKRVSSDLSFRNWTRKRIFVSLCLVLVDLLATVLSVYAVYKGNEAIEQSKHSITQNKLIALEACNRDNLFRQAYVGQWRTILELPPLPLPADATPDQKTNYEAQRVLRLKFQQSLNTDFATHPC